jgi:aspartokinase
MTQISNPADRVKIKKMLTEVSNSMTRIEAERDLIKETIKEMSQEFNLSKRQLNRMAKVYHKQNFSREQEEHSEFEDLYTSIVESNT